MRYGSRHPENTTTSGFNYYAKVLHISEAIAWAEIIVLAVPYSAYPNLIPELELASGKIVIDASNREPSILHDMSVAEELQIKLPKCRVIKAFNTLSAYQLSSDSGYSMSSPNAFFCGNDKSARATVSNMLQQMKFTPRDRGVLSYAEKLEKMPFEFLGLWRKALTFAVLTFIFIYTWQYYWYCKWYYPVLHGTIYMWNAAFLTVFNKTYPSLAIVLFSSSYLAGSFAAFYQLLFNSATRKFPWWLSDWLSVRKHLGLTGLWIAMQHAIMACLQMSNTFYYNLYDYTDKGHLNKYATRFPNFDIYRLTLFL